jgi:hypothetical protein
MPKQAPTLRQLQARAAQSDKFIDLHGIKEPKLLKKRVRRPVPGMQNLYEVTRTGRVWSSHKMDFMVDSSASIRPGVTMTVRGQRIYARHDFLASLAWLTPDQRADIRARSAAVTADVVSLAKEFDVGSYAVRAVIQFAETLFSDVVVIKQQGPQYVPSRG